MNIIISNCSYERSLVDVMNTWINDSSGSWGSAETIKYDSSNLINIKLDLYSAVFQLEEVKTQIEIMESYEAQWQGEAKQTYLDLKNILKQYCNDYMNSVEKLKICVIGLDSLLDQIPLADVIKEIDQV